LKTLFLEGFMRRFWFLRFSHLIMLSMVALPGVALAQSAPVAPVVQSPDDGMQAPGGQDPGGHHWQHGKSGAFLAKWQARFTTANTTHDGHLTLAQAQAAGLKPVVDHFSDIDAQKRGYVTFNEVVAWRLDQIAQRLEQRAAQLRAKD
jgi:hypothetical protein